MFSLSPNLNENSIGTFIRTYLLSLTVISSEVSMDLKHWSDPNKNVLSAAETSSLLKSSSTYSNDRLPQSKVYFNWKSRDSLSISNSHEIFLFQEWSPTWEEAIISFITERQERKITPQHKMPYLNLTNAYIPACLGSEMYGLRYWIEASSKYMKLIWQQSVS